MCEMCDDLLFCSEWDCVVCCNCTAVLYYELLVLLGPFDVLKVCRVEDLLVFLCSSVEAFVGSPTSIEGGKDSTQSSPINSSSCRPLFRIFVYLCVFFSS